MYEIIPYIFSLMAFFISIITLYFSHLQGPNIKLYFENEKRVSIMDIFSKKWRKWTKVEALYNPEGFEEGYDALYFIPEPSRKGKAYPEIKFSLYGEIVNEGNRAGSIFDFFIDKALIGGKGVELDDAYFLSDKELKKINIKLVHLPKFPYVMKPKESLPFYLNVKVVDSSAADYTSLRIFGLIIDFIFSRDIRKSIKKTKRSIVVNYLPDRPVYIDLG